MRYALVTIVLIAASGHAEAQTADGAARTVTSLIAIKSACGKLMAIDQEQASKLATGIINHGRELYGQRLFDRAVSKDIERRRAEVTTTGPQQWCTYQRGYLQSIGMTGIFLD